MDSYRARKLAELRKKNKILDHSNKLVAPKEYAASIKSDADAKKYHIKFLENWVFYLRRNRKQYIAEKMYLETFLLKEHFTKEEWPAMYERFAELEKLVE